MNDYNHEVAEECKRILNTVEKSLTNLVIAVKAKKISYLSALDVLVKYKNRFEEDAFVATQKDSVDVYISVIQKINHAVKELKGDLS
jgi:hypothetical protein